MLFDLQGKRRRLVQGTYLILAVLMGGGLVLFGIGSGDAGGGLFDAITGKNSNGNGSANATVNKRIQADEKAVRLNPKNTAALTDLIRSHYQLATDDADPNTGAFGTTGKQELAKAANAWQRYIKVAKTPNDSLAGLMLQAYGQGGLEKAAEAAQAAEFVANARPSPVAYLQLAQYASQAGQKRKADLAGAKAIELAPKGQKKLVEQQVAAAKAQGVVNPGQVTPSG
jgi:tetratricopeptide (TPR) repeat protein